MDDRLGRRNQGCSDATPVDWTARTPCQRGSFLSNHHVLALRDVWWRRRRTRQIAASQVCHGVAQSWRAYDLELHVVSRDRGSQAGPRPRPGCEATAVGGKDVQGRVSDVRLH